MKITIRGITKRFGKKSVLRGLSFAAVSGQCIGILGENGSGKSTLFGVLTGLQRGDGEFMCDGVDLLKDDKLRHDKVGFVPQSPPLLSELTARDNLRLWYKKAAMQTALTDGCLKMLGVDAFLRLPVKKMSGGMKKRLAIGCAIAHEPSVLLLDEPTAALDLVCKEAIYAYLRDFCARGGIAVLATHDVYELAQCDAVYVLKDGVLTPYDGARDLDGFIGCLT